MKQRCNAQQKHEARLDQAERDGRMSGLVSGQSHFSGSFPSAQNVLNVLNAGNILALDTLLATWPSPTVVSGLREEDRQPIAD
jgi:hypothetical protein